MIIVMYKNQCFWFAIINHYHLMIQLWEYTLDIINPIHTVCYDKSNLVVHFWNLWISKTLLQLK